MDSKSKGQTHAFTNTTVAQHFLKTLVPASGMSRVSKVDIIEYKHSTNQGNMDPFSNNFWKKNAFQTLQCLWTHFNTNAFTEDVDVLKSLW